jgi:hypothetical protein
MIVPFVVAFSASCSLNATVAPRPATNAGSSAARVRTGLGPAGDPGRALAGPAPVTRTPMVTANATDTTPNRVRRERHVVAVRGIFRVIVDSISLRNVAPVCPGSADICVTRPYDFAEPIHKTLRRNITLM